MTTNIKEVLRYLRSDRPVHVYLNGDSKPYLVQKSRLTSVSDRLKDLVTADREDYLSTRNSALWVLNDDADAWRVLLYWITTTRLPCENDFPNYWTLLAKCWALGEKYNIPIFQNYVMVELLYTYENDDEESEPRMAAINYAFRHTEPGSKLRELMAEEMVVKVYINDEDPKDLGVDLCDGARGFTTAVIKAHQEHLAHERHHLRGRFERIEKGKAVWKRFLIGNGSGLHWRPDEEEEEEEIEIVHKDPVDVYLY